MRRHFPRAVALGRHKALLACALCWHLAAAAADVVPSHLTGTWGTAESLYADNAEQVDIYLQPDGYGIMAGSAPPARRLDGKDDGKPALRAIAGFPLRATVDADMLTARLIALDPRGEDKARRTVITCTFDAAGPTLTCTIPGRPPVVMKRRSATVPEETARMLEQVRSVVR